MNLIFEALILGPTFPDSLRRVMCIFIVSRVLSDITIMSSPNDSTEICSIYISAAMLPIICLHIYSRKTEIDTPRLTRLSPLIFFCYYGAEYMMLHFHICSIMAMYLESILQSTKDGSISRFYSSSLVSRFTFRHLLLPVTSEIFLVL